MAVTACHYDRRKCSGQSDEAGMGIYTLGWIVETNSTMGPNAVLQGAQLISGGGNHPVPTRWTSYSYSGDSDGLSYARDFQVEVDPQALSLWYITVTYRPPASGEGSQTAGGTPINAVANPFNRAAVMWWDREVFTYEALHDKDGKPIVNKCQDYYPEPVELEATRGVLVVEKNVSSLAQVRSLSETYDNAVNSLGWNIQNQFFCNSRQALCREVSSGPPQTENGYVFFPVSLRFALQPVGKKWDVRKAEYGQFHWSKKSDGSYDTLTRGNTTHRALVNANALVPLNEDGTRRQHDQDVAVHQPVGFLLVHHQRLRIGRALQAGDRGVVPEPLQVRRTPARLRRGIARRLGGSGACGGNSPGRASPREHR